MNSVAKEYLAFQEREWLTNRRDLALGFLDKLMESVARFNAHYGIEVNLEGENKQLTVMSPIAGGPAYRAGIRAGDKILAVNGENMIGKNSSVVRDKVRGKKFSDSMLSIIVGLPGN